MADEIDNDVAVVAMPVDKQLFFAILEAFEVPQEAMPPAYTGVVEMDCEYCGFATEITDEQLKWMKGHPTTPVRCLICAMMKLNDEWTHEGLLERETLMFPNSGYVVVKASAA